MAVSVLKTCDPSVRRGDYCHPPAHSLHHRLQPPVVKQKTPLKQRNETFSRKIPWHLQHPKKSLSFFLQQTWVMFMPWFPIFELNHDLGRQFVVGGWEPTCTCGFGGILRLQIAWLQIASPMLLVTSAPRKIRALFAGRGNDRKWLKHLMT